MVKQRHKDDPQDPAASVRGEPNVGDVMSDGTIYAGTSPDTGQAMYTMPKDFGKTVTWKKAIALAIRLDALGHRDWRVPTEGELNVLFQNRGAIGSFRITGSYPVGWYWSSSQEIDDTAWGQHFSDGLQINYGKLLDSSLRCVRG